mmetsp:Transcript_70880/g.142703  ORF Transcript_70880/g.142703 Transcript_70880/m.142703 type:complete len:239 (-) Transcript_70880:824-1540(-)
MYLSLEVDGLVVGGHARLLERLRHGGVRVAGPRHVLRGRAVLERDHRLCDHLPRVGADDVRPQHTVRGLVRDDLDEPLRLVHGARAGVGAHGKGARHVLHAVLLELLLRLPHHRHLGERVDHARDRVVVHVTGEPGEVLHTRDALLFCLVRQHGPRNHVPNRKHRRARRLEVSVNLYAAEAVRGDAHGVQTQPVRVGAPADGDQAHVGVQHGRLALLHVLHRQLHLSVDDFGTRHFGA